MPRQKRAYVPKTKGCYECSQRRIHCDRTQPSCGKCVSRGLSCSGLGIRYRFSGDAGSSKVKVRRRNGSMESRSNQKDPIKSYTQYLHEQRLDIGSDMDAASAPENSPLQPNVDIVDWKEKFLLNHFSDNVAPQMVVMDDLYNGWRYLILPVACVDKMVMNAVSTVSASHISNKVIDPRRVGPDKFYTQAILGLRRRTCLNSYDLRERQFVFITILVLLVSVMITGSSDFPTLFHMLQSALDAIGGESGLGDSELSLFLVRQIHKIRVYAAPLLSRETGVRTILSNTRQSFDCLRYNSSLNPEYSSMFDVIAGLRQQAFDIYLQRTMPGSNYTQSAHRIERFKTVLEKIPDGSPGEHSLVWPTFIVASESCMPEQRLFFQQFLEKQFLRNGFSNILKGLALLSRIWESDDGAWPALLPEPRVFIM